MRVLLVEDERRLSDVIKKGLIESGYATDQAYNGIDGLHLAESESYDIIILDLMLPSIDGISICQTIRKKKVFTPILMLTAKTRLEDKVKGFDAGADDYLTKPFEFAELNSRIHALLRRSSKNPELTLAIDDLKLNPVEHFVKREENIINLTPKEFAILEYLMRHKDETVTRTQIIEHTWDYNFDSMSNVVDVFIATLRKKIDGGNKRKLIHTIHGVGYKISKKK